MVKVSLNSYLSLMVFTKMVHCSFPAPSEGWENRNRLAHPLLVLGPRVVRDLRSPDKPTVGNR